MNTWQKGGFRLTKFMSNNYQALSTKNVSLKSTEINLSVNDISLERALEYYGTQNRIHFLYIQISIYKICIYEYDYLYMYNIKYKCINKTCTQISLNYKMGYSISNKFYFWSVRTNQLWSNQNGVYNNSGKEKLT